MNSMLKTEFKKKRALRVKTRTTNTKHDTAQLNCTRLMRAKTMLSDRNWNIKHRTTFQKPELQELNAGRISARSKHGNR